MNKNIKNKTPESALTKTGRFLNRNANKIAVLMVMTIMISSIAMASGGITPATDPAETLWVMLTNLISKWVTRLGAVVIFIGGIMFALGWKSDDAEQKSRGISTIIAGAMVTAISALVGTFFQ